MTESGLTLEQEEALRQAEELLNNAGLELIGTRPIRDRG